MPSILIIEDDDTIQRLYSMAFGQGGYEVTSVTNAGTALFQLEDHTFDVMLLDLMMPGQSGLEFLKTFRQKFPTSQTKIIVASNLDNPVITEKVMALNVDHYFVKSNNDPANIVIFTNSALSKGQTSSPQSSNQPTSTRPAPPPFLT